MTIELPSFDEDVVELIICTTNDVTPRMLAEYERNGYDTLLYKHIVLIKR